MRDGYDTIYNYYFCHTNFFHACTSRTVLSVRICRYAIIFCGSGSLRLHYIHKKCRACSSLRCAGTPRRLMSASLPATAYDQRDKFTMSYNIRTLVGVVMELRSSTPPLLALYQSRSPDTPRSSQSLHFCSFRSVSPRSAKNHCYENAPGRCMTFVHV